MPVGLCSVVPERSRGEWQLEERQGEGAGGRGRRRCRASAAGASSRCAVCSQPDGWSVWPLLPLPGQADGVLAAGHGPPDGEVLGDQCAQGKRRARPACLPACLGSHTGYPPAPFSSCAAAALLQTPCLSGLRARKEVHARGSPVPGRPCTLPTPTALFFRMSHPTPSGCTPVWKLQL